MTLGTNKLNYKCITTVVSNELCYETLEITNKCICEDCCVRRNLMGESIRTIRVMAGSLLARFQCYHFSMLSKHEIVEELQKMFNTYRGLM